MGTVAKYIDPVALTNSVVGKRANINPMHDQNKVYGPIDVLTTTHIRDRGLNFNQEFTLTFKYSLKSIDGVDAKAAMLDLLSNALMCTYNNAKFWGGAYYWVGPRPSSFWSAALKAENAAIEQVLNGSVQGMGAALDRMKNTLAAEIQNTREKLKNDDSKTSMLASIARNVLKYGFAQLVNKIGRPSIPYMNSLLNGDPIGEWHLTIGNPLRPIACIGNLICTGAKIEPMSNTLGMDDFPMDWKITVSLKHGSPLDRAGIESILNAGKGRTYWVPSLEDVKSMNSWLNRKYRSLDVSRSGIDTVYKHIHEFMHGGGGR